MALKRAVGLGFLGWLFNQGDLLGRGVLGDSLGSLGDGVFRQFSGKDEPDSGLDFARRDRRPFVVVGQTRGLGGDALEDVVDEGVHDGHGLRRDSGVGVDLLEDSVDVDRVGLLSRLPPLLVPGTGGLLGLGGLLGSLGGWLWWHG